MGRKNHACTYVPEEAKVHYRSKDGRKENLFDALEWLAALCSHVPNKGEHDQKFMLHD